MSIFTSKSKIEKTMSEWLAHPSEYGEPPEVVKYRCVKKRKSCGVTVKVHLVDYEMSDGTKGLGFVGPFAWSFCEPKLKSANEEDILQAYMGMVFLMIGEDSEMYKTEFDSKQSERDFIAKLQDDGCSEIETAEKFKLLDFEIFEFKAIKGSKKIKGVGCIQEYIFHDEDDPLYLIPQYYIYFGDI